MIIVHHNYDWSSTNINTSHIAFLIIGQVTNNSKTFEIVTVNVCLLHILSDLGAPIRPLLVSLYYKPRTSQKQWAW